MIKDTNKDYHTKRAISNSMMKEYLQNPFMAGVRYWSDIELPEVQNEAFKQGDALHARILEPERYAEEYCIKPEGLNLVTKEGKAWKADNADKTIVDPIINEQSAILQASPFQRWFEEGQNEVSIYSEIEGVPVKARFDCLYDDCILDLKTTSAWNEQQFLEACIDFKYDLQQAWYSKVYESHFGRPPKAFIFLAVTKKSPVNIFYQVLPARLVNRGEILLSETLPQVIHSIKKNHWPLKESSASLDKIKPWILEEAGL